jgi:hypothetical protein
MAGCPNSQIKVSKDIKREKRELTWSWYALPWKEYFSPCTKKSTSPTASWTAFDQPMFGVTIIG